MKKIIDLSTELNTALRTEALRRGTSANKLITEILLKELNQSTKPERETLTEKEPEQVNAVKDPDKNGRFLLRLGRWTNGKCYRIQHEDGTFSYSYK